MRNNCATFYGAESLSQPAVVSTDKLFLRGRKELLDFILRLFYKSVFDVMGD